MGKERTSIKPDLSKEGEKESAQDLLTPTPKGEQHSSRAEEDQLKIPPGGKKKKEMAFLGQRKRGKEQQQRSILKERNLRPKGFPSSRA